jgi:DNA end-binding protein Ku
MLINQLSTPFKPEDFKDTFSEEIKKIIEEKVKTGKISSINEAQPEKPAEVIDLLEKLKLSLEEAKKKNAS